MRTLSAARASRAFSELLDRVERGETIRITRAGHVVAELRRVAPTTGRALRDALASTPGLDDDVEADVASATSLLIPDESDPSPAG